MPQPRRSRSDWQALVLDWRDSQLTAAQFARRRRLDPRRLRWWAWYLRQADAPPAAPTTDLVGFIELPAPPRATNDDRVELVLTNGRRLSFSAAIDVGLLARIVSGLDAGAA
jgi:hypothetical protein